MKENTNLENLFNPRSIAVIGATNTPGRVGRIIFEQLLGFKGCVYPVNIRETQGLQDQIPGNNNSVNQKLFQ